MSSGIAILLLVHRRFKVASARRGAKPQAASRRCSRARADCAARRAVNAKTPAFASRHGCPYDAPMRWLLHGNLNASVGEALRRHGHEARQPADVGLPADAPADDVLHAAHKNQLDLITPDQAVATNLFADRFNFDRSIVFLHVGDGDVEQDDAIDRLFARYKRLTPGRLYTVTESHVKVRQLPARP